MTFSPEGKPHQLHVIGPLRSHLASDLMQRAAAEPCATWTGGGGRALPLHRFLGEKGEKVSCGSFLQRSQDTAETLLTVVACRHPLFSHTLRDLPAPSMPPRALGEALGVRGRQGVWTQPVKLEKAQRCSHLSVGPAATSHPRMVLPTWTTGGTWFEGDASHFSRFVFNESCEIPNVAFLMGFLERTPTGRSQFSRLRRRQLKEEALTRNSDATWEDFI